MDSRPRVNDIKGSGNDKSRDVLQYTPTPNAISNSDLSVRKASCSLKNNKKILSREESLGWIREIKRGLGANG